MIREVNMGTYVKVCTNSQVIGNIIESYKGNNDDSNHYESSGDDASSVLTTARDGELIYGARALKKEDGWYLDFQNGKADGPYQEITYDAQYLYCTIIFGLAYRYELSGLLNGVGSQYGYYAYLKQFIKEHKDDYEKFKEANLRYERMYSISKYQRGALFELDYRRQRRLAYHNRQHYVTANNQERQI